MKEIINKNKQKFSFKQFIIDYAVITLGCLIYAFAVEYFIAPNKISGGGVTGIAILINYITGFPTGSCTFLINIPLIVAALIQFGFGMLAKTAYATLLSSFFIDIFDMFVTPYTTENTILPSIFGGVIGGIGLGLVFLRGGTTGGSDILAKLIRKKRHNFSIGKIMIITDLIVITATLIVYKSIESALFSLIVIFLMGKAIDYVVYGNSQSKMILVITEKKEEIISKIFEDDDCRGITIIPAEGAYSGNEKNVLLTVVRPNEVVGVNNIIKSIDSNAFTIITDATEVYGAGFKKTEN